MAEAKTVVKEIEREYTIPLRREWQKVVRYKRTSRSIKAIKKYIAKHMKVPDRDTSKVKLDVYLNNQVWHRGTKKPPSKIRVRATKKGDIIEVRLLEESDDIQFARARQNKRHSKIDKKKAEIKPSKKKETLEDKTKTEPTKDEESKASEEKKKEDKEKKSSKPKTLAPKIKDPRQGVSKPKNTQTFRKALKK